MTLANQETEKKAQVWRSHNGRTCADLSLRKKARSIRTKKEGAEERRGRRPLDRGLALKHVLISRQPRGKRGVGKGNLSWSIQGW